jgi:hypothetical protein
MSTTTSYGTWLNLTDTSLNVRQSVEESLGEFGDEYDVNAIERDYRAAIDAALPEGVTLAGDEFYGPHPINAAAFAGIEVAVDGVDFWAIVERHAR